MPESATRPPFPASVPHRSPTGARDASEPGGDFRLLGLGLAVALLFLWRITDVGLVVDDAFIIFRYADHLAQGHGLTYNPGEFVEGTSSLSWTVVLAAGSALGLHPPDVAPLLGALLGLGALSVFYLLARRVLGCGTVATLIALGGLALNTSFGFWSVSGMEAPLFSLLLLGAWGLGCSRTLDSDTGAALLGATAALLAWTRPEALAALVLVPLGLLWRRTRLRSMLVASALVLVGVGLQLAWRHLTYEQWLPNTVQAKAGVSMAATLRGLEYVWGFLWDDGALWLLPLLAASRWRCSHRAGLGALLLLYLAFVVAVGGDGLYRYRLLGHVSPLLFLLVADALDRLGKAHRKGLAVGGALVVAGAAAPLFESAFFRGFSLAEIRSWEERWEHVGRALAPARSRRPTLATNVAGRVPYRSDLRTLDLLGLTDPVIAQSPVEGFGSSYAGHERAAPKYVLARRPDLFYLSVFDRLPEALFCRASALRTVLAAGSLYRYVPLVTNPRFLEDYSPARLSLSTGEPANVFARNEALASLTEVLPMKARGWCKPEGALEP